MRYIEKHIVYKNSCFTIQNITYYQEESPTFKRINLSGNIGNLVIIKGNNGSGKSTFLKAASGLLGLHTGEVYWNHSFLKNFITDIHLLTHDTNLNPDLTVSKNLVGFCILYNQRISKLNKFLLLMDLYSVRNIKVRRLSEGQKRRTHLMRLLLVPNPVWLLDEPITALDRYRTEAFIKIMKLHTKYKGVVIITTHRNFNFNRRYKVHF
nr:cytochrome c1 ABC transporter ATP-binding subunit [Cavernulicola chilensis]